ncbi:MAG: putative ABC transporter permease [Treponema sp.]|nr:putative ABC transporter permease [Treponema sp.]MBQ7166327.1 putative ABC transporter permease [Treponema sp.]
MNMFLVLTFLFFAGSLIGWGIELIWRRFFSANNPERKWINPGFLTGPYLPLYGLSLSILFTMSFIDVSFVKGEWAQKIVLFVIMALCITVLEYFAGLVFIKGMKIKLWDYSACWGNIQGIICPQYSFYWVLLSAVYYFIVHPRILEWLYWFTNHLAFCLVVGFFYGVFTVDLCYTLGLSAKIRAFANEKQIEVHYENLKLALQKRNEQFREKRRFLFQLYTNGRNFAESLREALADNILGK